MIERPVNARSPATALWAAVPPSVPVVPETVRTDAVIDAVDVVIVLPKESTTRTTGWVPSAWPVEALPAAGCVAMASADATAGWIVTVALSVIGVPL